MTSTQEPIGKVTHFFGHLGVAVVKLDQPLKVGDTVRVTGAHDDLTFKVESMQMDHQNVPEAKAGQEVGIKFPGKAHEGSVVHRVAS